MTMQSTLTAGVPAPAAISRWRSELAETVRLAWPIALTQLGQIAMMTTDLALLGRLGDHVVAASALAGYMAPPSELGLRWDPEKFGV